MSKSAYTRVTITTTGAHACAWCQARYDAATNHGGPPIYCTSLCAGRALRARRYETRTCEWCGHEYRTRTDQVTRACCREHGVWLQPTTRKVMAIPQAKPALDQRSPLRRALEAGAHSDVVALLAERTERDAHGCWIWQGWVNRDGYPIVNVGRRRGAPVHRMMLEAHLGAPLGSQAAHHRCANTRCVSPTHLQPITARENTAEMLARTYLLQRIRGLEAALATIHPEHPLLAEVGITHAA